MPPPAAPIAATPAPPSAPRPPLAPLPKPVVAIPDAQGAGPTLLKPVLAPKKETSRLEPLPFVGGKLPPAPTLKLEKTQPLMVATTPMPLARPGTKLPGALPVSVASPRSGSAAGVPADSGEPVPLLVSAGIFVLALVTFLVQLWAYLRPE